MASDIKFELSTERLSIRDVFERYGHCLPVIIQVTQGHYGGDIDMDTYSTGHTMRIHKCCKQRRVVAEDKNGRHLSFPEDYPIRCRVAENRKKVGKEQTLKEIVEGKTLPVRIELCLPPTGYSLHFGQSIKQIESVGALQLIDTYEETYLLANSISEGCLDNEVMCVPIYLKDLLVGIVQGIVGGTPTVFNAFRKTLYDEAQKLCYDIATGNPDIAVYSPESVSSSSENIYDYIEPSHFIKCKQTKPSRAPAKSQALTPKQEKTKQSHVHTSTSAGAKGIHVYAQIPAMLSQEPLNTNTPPPIPARSRVVSESKESPINESTARHQYVNNIGRATVTPFHKDPPKIAPKPIPVRPVDETSTLNYVKDYSIIQIMECLPQLRLEKYSETFQNEQISGEILLELGEDTLKEDFQMKGYEAIKLMKFARSGYIPH